MNTVLLTILFAVLMLTVTVTVSVMLCHALSRANDLKARLKEVEADNQSLQKSIQCFDNKGGVSEAAVLAIAGEIARMENNLYHMEDVPGRKQIAKAIERIKANMQAEGYVIEPLLGKYYQDGMQMTASFLTDENLPYGSSVISSVQKPQVNRAGKMIQAAVVTVRQNI